MGILSKIFSNTRKPERFFELCTHLTAAGFRDIAVHRNEQRHWLCVTAEK